LLSAGADIEERGGPGELTPLHWAVAAGNEAGVRLLLEDGADMSARDNDRRTPLHYATQDRHEVVLQLLLEKGADVSAKDSEGFTPLHCAATSTDGSTPLARLLLQHGADVSAKSKGGETALHLAASGGHEALVLLLLAHGSDVSAKTKSGYTSEEVATALSFHGIAETLRAEAARRAHGVAQSRGSGGAVCVGNTGAWGS